MQARACSVDQVLLGWYRIPRTIDEPVQLVRGPPAPRFAKYRWWCLQAELTQPGHASGALRLTCCKLCQGQCTTTGSKKRQARVEHLLCRELQCRER